MRGRSTRTPTGEARAEACPADWRRPGDYRFCDRPTGHRGRHRLVPARPEPEAPRGPLRRLVEALGARLLPPLLHH